MKHINYRITTGIITACFLAFSISLSAFQSAFAQQHFEGEVVVNLYSQDDGSTEQVTLLIKDHRLMLAGVTAGEDVIGMAGEGLLIRADYSDIIIFGEDNSGIQIKSGELQSMMGMFMGPEAIKEIEDDIDEELAGMRMRNTSETRTVSGVRLTKSILTSEDEPGNEAHVWFADDVYINWANLFSPVGFFTDQLNISSKLTALGWPEGKSPMMVEIFEDGNKTTMMEVVELNSRSLSDEEVGIPSGTNVISFMQMMMEGFAE